MIQFQTQLHSYQVVQVVFQLLLELLVLLLQK
jgi:hypothetical protein